jgi:hypothetical protein
MSEEENKKQIDIPLFDKIKFSDLSRKIYSKNRQREKLLNNMIDKLDKLVENTSDATFIVPLIQGLIDSDIRNGDLDIRFATLWQKILLVNNKDEKTNANLLELSDEEMSQLEELSKNVYKLEEKNQELDEDLEDLEENIYSKLKEKEEMELEDE